MPRLFGGERDYCSSGTPFEANGSTFCSYGRTCDANGRTFDGNESTFAQNGRACDRKEWSCDQNGRPFDTYERACDPHGRTYACALPAMLHAEWGDDIHQLDFSVHDQKSGDQRLSVDSFGEETHSAGLLDGMSIAGSRV
jgi:hypothetical protein